MIRLGADVGGTTLRLRVQREGEAPQVYRRSWSAGARTPEDLVAHLERLLDAAGLEPGGEQPSLGLAIAGQLDARARVVRNAPNLGWRDVALGSLLEARLAGRVGRIVLLNDLHAAALAEVHGGAARGYAHALLVFVGTGVGGALVLGGRLVRGEGGVAGEIGHVKVQGEAAACGCGERGCVEALCGGRALEASLRQEVPALAEAARPLADWQGAIVRGDSAATALCARRGAMLGRVIAGAVTLFNPGIVVLGGGVLRNVPAFRERVEASIRADVLRASALGLRIESAHCGDDSGAVGAALAAERVEGLDDRLACGDHPSAAPPESECAREGQASRAPAVAPPKSTSRPR